ncbi:hypothetical protein GWI33_018895 [Rhynchophorus ferrugineus]|uniref:Uncharacterized protein n=1 Tax=Rhynchophorus ferrugineus TaxID=354439 RepID=A0A834M1W4_RHYFE|nr:hypothetical protein GWI33_018895 [Rhynchophorus ferrugineus]
MIAVAYLRAGYVIGRRRKFGNAGRAGRRGDRGITVGRRERQVTAELIRTRVAGLDYLRTKRVVFVYTG